METNGSFSGGRVISDVAPPRTEGSLAVAHGAVVAVYGLYLVEASPAIYVVQALGVAGVDAIVTRPSVDNVVTLAGFDLVIADAASSVSSPTPPLR